MPEPEIEDSLQLQEARALWNRGDREAALASYAKAVAAARRNVRGLLEYARALAQVYRISEGEALLEQVRSLAGDDDRLLPPLVQTYQDLYRPATAIEVLEAARRGKQLAPPLLGELAVLYEKTNQVDQAIAAIEECISQAPGQPEPHLIQARLERRRGNVDAAEAVLLEVIAASASRPQLMVQALAELCLLRDEQGDYDGAWETNEQAKQIYRRFPDAERMSRHALALNATFCQLYERLDTATLRAWHSLDLPSDSRCGGVAHLLGFPRTGTTLLEQCLGAHPRLVDSPERAVFTRDIFPAMHALHGQGQGGLTLDVLNGIPRERLIAQRTRYFDAMEAIQGEPLGGRVHLDKNPNHMSLIAGLYRLFPESRFLVALRDPRDVLVSVYLRQFPLSEFGAGLLTPGSACLMYANDMNIWLRLRALLDDQWLEVKYEDTVTDLAGQARRAIEFLGLDWGPRVLEYRDRSSHKVVNSPSHDKVREPVYRSAVARWKNYERHLTPYFDRLTPFVRAFGYE